MDGGVGGDLLGLFSKGDARLPPVHEEYVGSKYAMITKNEKTTVSPRMLKCSKCRDICFVGERVLRGRAVEVERCRGERGRKSKSGRGAKFGIKTRVREIYLEIPPSL